jgi:MFS family permease
MTIPETQSIPPITRIDELMSAVGFGKFQLSLSLIPCFMLMSDAMIVTLLSFVRAPAAAELCSDHASAAQAVNLIPVVAFTGMLFGAPFAGWISDHYGRRPGALEAAVAIAVGLFTMAFSPNLAIFYIGDFISGVGGGSLHVAQTLLAEFVPHQNREQVITFYGTFWTTGVVVESVLFAFVWGAAADKWRALTLASAVPSAVVVVLAYFLLPESPRFLHVAGRDAEADRLLLHMAEVNGTDELTSHTMAAWAVPTYGSTDALDRPPRQPDDGNADGAAKAASPVRPTTQSASPKRVASPRAASAQRPQPKTSLSETAMRLFTVPYLRSTTLRLWVMWLVSTAAYYCVVMATPNFGSAAKPEEMPVQPTAKPTHHHVVLTPAAAVVFMAMCEYPSYLLMYIVAKNVGRRKGLTVCCAATVAVGGLWVAVGSQSAYTALVIGMFRMTLLVNFNLLWLITPEVFPTTLRSTGCGSCHCISRVAGAAAPYILMLDAQVIEVMAAVVFAMSAAASFTLPRDTANQPLTDTVDGEDNINSVPTSTRATVELPVIEPRLVVSPVPNPLTAVA